jgi:hypothetical protein
MTPAQIETWVLSIVERVTSGGRAEDDRVECKAIWPDPPGGAARQLAGQANAARGAPVLWIIGLDEDAHRVTGAGDLDPATWWPQVERRFAELAPNVRTFSVPVESGQTVMALFFETDRAPYVVTTDSQGGVQREVPWRSAAGTRTAHRRELLQMVIPAVEVPTLHLISVHNLEAHVITETDDGTVTRELRFYGAGRAFFDAAATAMLPAHLAEGTVRFDGPAGTFEAQLAINFHHKSFGMIGNSRREEPHPAGVDVSSSGIYINGPGALEFNVTGASPAAAEPMLTAAKSCRLSVSLAVARSDRRVQAALDLERQPPRGDRGRNYWAGSGSGEDPP